jgi:hypothetical protein
MNATHTHHTAPALQYPARWLCAWATMVTLASWASSPSAQAAESVAAGHIKVVHGQVTIQNSRGAEQPAVVGATLHEGDVITTGVQAEMHAEMVDGGYLAARPEAHIRIVAYHLSGARDDRSWLELLRGGMRFVTGWVARSNPPAYRLKTPLATIGIRGTDFEVQHLSPAEASTPEEVGTHMLVYEGTTTLANTAGDVDVTAGVAAFALNEQAPPRLHGTVPGFMTRKRGHFDNLADEQAADIKAVMMAKLAALSLSKTGETLQQRLDRFRAENPESDMSDREVLERVIRRAKQRAGNDAGGRSNRGSRR